MSWPTRHGTNRGTAWCRHPGPLKGSVSSRWIVPDKRRAEYVVIAEDGRIAVPGPDKEVHLLAPDLRPLEKVATPGYVRDVIATPKGFLAAAGGVIAMGGETVQERLSEPWFKWGPHGLRLLDDGSMLLYDGSDFVRVDPQDGKELARFRTESTMSSTRSVAIGPDGIVWSAMAMSWQSGDDPPEATEYYASLAAFEAGGARLEEWSYDDGLPTSTGISLRLLALRRGVLISDSGTSLVRPGSRAPIPRPGVGNLSVPDDGDGTLALGISRRHWLVRVPIPATPPAGGVVYSDFDPLELAGSEDAWVKALVSDGAGHVYVGTDKAILGLRDDGAELFRVEPFPVRSLALGEGYLIAVSDAGDGAIVRIH